MIVMAGFGSGAEGGSWSTNGGTPLFTADGQSLRGNLVADSISSVNLTLQNGSALTGTINADKRAKAVNLTLDASST
jgi:hypothetical protein